MSLSGRVAIVTGATGALGRVVVRALLRHGVHVVATYRDEEKKAELDAFLGDAGRTVTLVQTDVAIESSVQALLQKAVDQHGRVDILLNIVGAYKGGMDIANTSESDWDIMMDVNLKSAFLCSKITLPHMMKQNYGKIVSVASRTAVDKRYRSKNGAYAISKAGIIVLTETIAEEVKKYDINVNCIMPSTIDTAANRQNLPDADFSKWVDPEQIAKVVLFLISDDSRTINGASVPVYGKA